MSESSASSIRQTSALTCLAVAVCALVAGTGCAVNYYDKATGTEHLWGFGHLKMRAVPQNNDHFPFTNAVVAIATGMRTFGINLGVGGDHAGVVAGWDSRSRIIIKQDDASFYLFWPTNTFWWPKDLKDHLFQVRVGPDFPFTNGPAFHNPRVPKL